MINMDYMNIEGHGVTIYLEGRLDTNTTPEIESEMLSVVSSSRNVTIDFENIEYISSAGLRLLLNCQKIIANKSGVMKIINVAPHVMDVFEVTGFTDVLTIE